MGFSDPLARARRAYELARVGAGVRAAWPLVVIVPVAIVLRGPAFVVPTLAAAAALGLVVVTLVWRGGALARGVGLGFAAGLSPLLLPAAWALARGVPCVAACDMPSVDMGVECVVTCAIAGLAAGGLVGWRARSRGAALSAALVAGGTGALGCALVGLAGVIGIFAGVTLGAAPVVLARSARASS
jgi:hypothetical protein